MVGFIVVVDFIDTCHVSFLLCVEKDKDTLLRNRCCRYQCLQEQIIYTVAYEARNFWVIPEQRSQRFESLAFFDWDILTFLKELGFFVFVGGVLL